MNKIEMGLLLEEFPALNVDDIAIMMESVHLNAVGHIDGINAAPLIAKASLSKIEHFKQQVIERAGQSRSE